MRTPAFNLDPQVVADYQSQGAVIIRNALNAQEIEILTHGIEHNLAHLSPLALVASLPDDPGHFVEDFCTWQNNPDYRHILCNTALPSIAKQLMQSETVRIYHDHMLVKEAATRQPTPWHQDQPYYNISGHQNVSFWIPVDSVPLESTLRFVAGSHQGTWYMPRTFRDNQAKWFAEGTLQELPDIEGQPEQHQQLAWAMQPGDIVAFHMLTLHASAGVGANQRRRVFSARYMGDDTRHAVRPWRTSPPFTGLSEVLPNGAVMQHEWFPVVA